MRPAPAAALAVALAAAALAAWLALRPSPYPTDPASWDARWADAAAEISRTPGEGWPAWTAAAESFAAALETDPEPDALLAAAESLAWPDRVTPPRSTDAPGPPDWSPLAHALSRAVATAGPDRALDLAALARRIERGIGLGRGLPGADARHAFGAAVDHALIAALAAGRFTAADPETVQARLQRLLALAVDDAGFDFEWSLREHRETLLARTDLSHADRVFADQLFYQLDESRRGRARGVRRVETMRADLAAGRRPVVAAAVGDLEAVFAARRAARAPRVALLVMVALEQHRLRTGVYPESLRNLTPHELVRVPVDPFGFGERFGYRPVDPAAGVPASAYRLWSVGPDRDDDDGRPTPVAGPDAAGDGDMVFCPPQPEAAP